MLLFEQISKVKRLSVTKKDEEKVTLSTDSNHIQYIDKRNKMGENFVRLRSSSEAIWS
jgi:hypothetical protein